MNKLVSRNPIQRFKQGKKIIKAEEGAVARWQRRIKSGINGIGSAFKGAFDITFNPNNTQFGSQKIYNFAKTVPSRIINGLVVENYTPENGGTTNNRLRNKQQNTAKQNTVSTPKDYSFMTKGTLNSESEQSKKQREDYFNKQKQKYNFVSTPSKEQNIISTNNVWLKGYKHNEVKDVRAMQNELIKLGLLKDKFGADGKWGDNTERAYKQYLALKNVPTYEKTPEQTVDISSPSKVLNSTVVNQEPLTPEQQTEQNIVNNNLQTTSNPLIPEQKVFARNGNYNKSQIRDYMRQMGLNPYSFSGSDRKALRQWLNGETDDWGRLAFKNSRLYDVFVKPYGYKQGGQLVSKDPVKRFKLNFR